MAVSCEVARMPVRVGELGMDERPNSSAFTLGLAVDLGYRIVVSNRRFFARLLSRHS